jgi:hypothetical protein
MQGRALIATTGKGITCARQGGDGKWVLAEALGGHDVQCLTVDRLNPGRLYAGSEGEGVLRSDDGGTAWRACGLAGRAIKAIAASPAQSGLLYAGTRPAALFVSRDGGLSWEEVVGFRRIPWRWLWFSPAERPFRAYVQAIALSPTDPDRVVVGVEFGATVLSEDGGRTWSGHRPGALRDCHSLAFHPAFGDWVYEGGGTGVGASFSRDGGRTWTQRRDGLDRPYGWAVAADPETPEIWYASLAPGPRAAHGGLDAQAGIFRQDGSKWHRLAGGLPEPLRHMPYALITDPDVPGNLYAGLSNGDVWHSGDRGDSWRQLPVSLGAIHRSLVMI